MRCIRRKCVEPSNSEKCATNLCFYGFKAVRVKHTASERISGLAENLKSINATQDRAC